MRRNHALMPAGALMLLGSSRVSARRPLAAPPQITKIAPLGVRRGLAAEVTVSGANLAGNPRLIAPFSLPDRASRASVKSDAANWKIEADRRGRCRCGRLSDPDSNRRWDLQPVSAGGRPAPADC